MFGLALVIMLPCIVIIVSALMVRRGAWTWMSLVAVGATLAIAISHLRLGVSVSCQIDESECLGAKATSYLVVALWTLPAIGFVGRVIAVHRSKG